VHRLRALARLGREHGTHALTDTTIGVRLTPNQVDAVANYVEGLCG
jgi:hypothetical protein